MKCRILLILLLLPVWVRANDGDAEVIRKINREFAIRSDGYLTIDNRYGNLDIAIGQGNSIRMDITIRAEASSQKKAQEAVDRIQVIFEEGSNRVKARTEIQSASGWTSWFQSGSMNVRIHYQVLVPADIYLELINKYGDIYVETTQRDLRINLGYGDIRLGDIKAGLTLQMAYSDGRISQIQDGNLKLSYSDLEMEDAWSLNVDMKYSDLAMGSAIRTKVVSAYSELKGLDIDELIYSGKYDDLTLDRVKTIDAETGYSDISIQELSQQGNFSMKYGGLVVRQITPGFSKLNITTSYTGVSLGFAEHTSFAVDAQNNYCSIQHTGLRVQEDIRQGSSTILKASKGSGGGKVSVRMNYGSLRLQ